MLRGLYLITRESSDDAALLAVVESALAGGAALVQYRDKSRDAARRLRQSRALVALCASRGVPLVVNDDVSLARDSGAAGVHLGRGDATPRAARATLGADAIVGVSCYDSGSHAEDAVRGGASYVAFGAFFASGTKPGARRAEPALLVAARALPVPKVAIGGITPDNAHALVAAGADLIAVCGAIFDAPDPRATARAFTALYDAERT